MIIKKFQADTETEAIILAKNDLGKDAIVMNIKTISPKGIFRLFRKSTVEVTAAVDENVPVQGENPDERTMRSEASHFDAVVKSGEGSFNKGFLSQEDKTSVLEEKLNTLQSLLEKQISAAPEKVVPEKKEKENEDAMGKNMACVKLIYNQLVDNEVDETYANQIINEIEPTLKKDMPVDAILASVYQKIILKLGQPQELDFTEGKTKFVFFIGPTGVGKTTTIAKLASSLKVNKKAKVALLTSDTYRIAAVEQLRTYANIMDVPIRVIYSEVEMAQAREDFHDYDIVLVDTAGRSHKSIQQRDDIEKLIQSVPDEDRKVYLVLSAATKYKDLQKIAEVYSDITNYHLIFTKLDETGCIGNLLNIRMYTNAPLSYATFGQNVPDDIARIDAQEIARKLLGGNE